MSGGLARTCATALAVGALLFVLAITLGVFSPPVLRSVTARASLDASSGQAGDRQRAYKPPVIDLRRSDSIKAANSHSGTQHNATQHSASWR